MAFNHRIEKTKNESSGWEDASDFKMNRVMSAPPQEQLEESLQASTCLLENDRAESPGKKRGEGKLESMLASLTVKERNVLDSIPETESSDEEMESEYIRFMQIEKLIREFPPVDLDILSDQISELLRTKERTPMEMKFCFAKGEETYLEKIKNMKAKVDTDIEKVRIEFNRATATNISSVIENLMKIRIERVNEMKEIAAFVFEKVISEPVFVNVYIKIIGELYKTWTCDEEKKLKDVKKQSCFYGTLLTLAFKKFETQHSWFAQVDESILSSTNGDIDDKIEEHFSERLIRRQHALGTVNFVGLLYVNNITGVQNVINMVDKLTATFSPENIIMICTLFSTAGHKLMSNNRQDTLRNMLEYLKTHSKCEDLRLQVEIDKTFKNNAELMVVLRPVGGTQRANSFASLRVEESKQPVVQKTDEEALEEYIIDLSATVGSISDPDDLMDLGDRVFKDMDKFGNQKFLKAYFIETITNHKICPKFRRLFVERLFKKAVKLSEALLEVKDDMPMLAIDFPCSNRNFSELLCYFKAGELLNGEEFAALRPDEFLKRAGSLLKEWKDSEDDRLSKVLMEGEIQKL